MCSGAWLTFHRHDGLKKTELELALEDFLTTNSSTYSNDPRFTSFYGKRRSESSPVKKETSSALSDIENKAKAVRRRVTKAAEDILAT
jgi:hypothetical protein